MKVIIEGIIAAITLLAARTIICAPAKTTTSPRSIKSETDELFPPPSLKAVGFCSFEVGSNCSHWKPSAKSTIPFSPVGRSFSSGSGNNNKTTNNFITTPLGSKGTALLTTRFLQPVSSGFKAFCVSFLYQINGTADTKLAVFEHIDGNMSGNQVWAVTGEGGGTKGQWRFHTSQITSGVPVKILFSATSSGGGSFIALDDISIYNGTCYVRDGDSTKAYEGSSRAISMKAVTWIGQTVPYELTDGFADFQIDMIQRFFDEISSRTCVEFVQRNSYHTDYVKFAKADQNCIANIGRTGGAQLIQLGDECFDTYGVLSHTILHVLGLRHEHVRSDRDIYVRVNLGNVDAEAHKAYFTKRPAGMDAELEKVTYDKQSVMHFAGDAYAIESANVLESRSDPDEVLGNTDGPRNSDYQKVANLYCSGVTSRPSARRTTTIQPSPVNDDNTPCIETNAINGRSSGTVSNYIKADGRYRSGEACAWRIRVGNGKLIKLDFTTLDVKSSSGCRDNSIVLRDGPDETSAVLTRLCGQQHPLDAFTTSDSVVFIKFTTKDSQGTGFRLNWREFAPAQDDYSNAAALSPVDCSFENNQCTWLDYSTTTHWKIESLDSLTAEDHTTQSDIGSYMSVDAAAVAGTNKVVTMRSGRVSTADGYRCFSFYYRLTRYIGTLEVSASLTDGREKSLWSSLEDPSISDAYSSWARAQIPVDASMDGSTSYRLVFKATIRKKMTGGVGVDDVTLSQEFCDEDPLSTTFPPPPKRTTTTPRPAEQDSLSESCDFEASLCRWKPSVADVTWRRKSGKSSPGSSYGVSYDNTKKTANGQYLVVNGISKGVARLDIQIPSNMGYKCFQFYYMMFGRNVGRLSVKVIPASSSSDAQDEMVIFEVSGNKPSKWLQGTASLDGLSIAYTLRIEAIVTGQQDGDIAVDDVAFSKSNCYSTRVLQATPLSTSTTYRTPPNNYFCDFEDNSLCGQTLQLENDDDIAQQWQVLSPADVKSSGGPNVDVSKKTADSRFAGFIGSRSLRSKGSMSSKKYATNEVNCMTFWYYLGGLNVGETTSLTVYQVVRGKPENQVFVARGISTTLRQWINPQVSFVQNQGDFVIRFTAETGGLRSIILIDDISLSRNDKCTAIPRTAQLLPMPQSRNRREAPVSTNVSDTGATTTKIPRHRLIIGSSTRTLTLQTLLQCRFGQGSFCGWVATSQWQLASTSVDQDIAGADDRFAYVSTGRLMMNSQRAANRNNAEIVSNVTGIMTSQVVDVTANRAKQSCLHFWYKVAGWFRDLPMDTLNVYIRSGISSASPKRLIASFSGSMTLSEAVDAWTEEKLTLFESSNFQVIFEAMTGDSWMGTIAIDDVELRAATCPRAGYNTN